MPEEEPREPAIVQASAADRDGAALIGRAADASDETDEPIDFLELGHGRREVLVRLAGQTYRLRWTRNDKLILTK